MIKRCMWWMFVWEVDFILIHKSDWCLRWNIIYGSWTEVLLCSGMQTAEPTAAWCWHWDTLIFRAEQWLPRADLRFFKGWGPKGKREKPMAVLRSLAPGGTLNTGLWQVCLLNISIDFRLAWTVGHPKSLVLPVWQVIDWFINNKSSSV